MIQKIRLPLSLSPHEINEQSSNSKHGFAEGVRQCGSMGVCAGVVPWWPKETGGRLPAVPWWPEETGVEKEMDSWVS
ncbi:hypothetical protein FH972_000732 [Carpinus fangiana]|uniref:Uncharacterized protein n=1 Tax=Carpinus fangiana TaxID=176857 RepID=A0A5N6QBZ4_9ROSI|nr:hypothetical protein FH972_000732 [Carpinus fangiana]